MGSEHYCLRWNNHQSNLLGVFSQLLRDESLVDVTLACSEGHSIRAHKVVLSACSSYFQTLFIDHPSRHPIVILKDVRFSELRTLIEFMYKGEVNVEYCQLSALLKTAESLKVKGLAEMTRDYKPPEEQMEPTELISRKITEPRSLSPDENEEHLHNSPSSIQNLRVCKSPIERERERDRDRDRDRDRERNRERERDRDRDREKEKEIKEEKKPSSVENVPQHVSSDCGASDMSIHNSNSIVASCSSNNPSAICNRLSSPINCEPLPGPSNMPPVQQVPLSLKKEVDWGGGEDKNTGESSSEYSRHLQDSVIMESDRCIGSPVLDRPSSTQSSRSSTPFALPFPTLPASLLEVGLMHPALLGDEVFRCSACMAAFPSLWLLEQHAALQHVGSVGGTLDKPFVCEQCGQSYRYRSAYVKHREQNHRARLPADKLFSCDVCGMQFRYLKSFKKHRLNHALEKLHGKSADIPKEVKDNPEEESSRSIQENSSDQVSSSNETINIEEEGSPIVVKKENISDDVAVEGTSSDAEKTEGEQDDTIDSIAFSFRGTRSSTDVLPTTPESSIMNFLRTDPVDRQRERRFACPFCGKCVRSKENLKLHVRKHTGERPFVCLFCGRAFGGKSDLTRHLRIHTGERPYHCDMCGKCFARADYLSKHLTTHINTPR